MGSSKESFSLLYKAFLQPLLTYASPEWFLFLSITNITKLEHLHQVASRTIADCLLSSPIPFLFSEASLPPLQLTLTHVALLFYEWALHLPTSLSISGLARLGVKPKLCKSSWRAFASTHLLMLPSASREALLACPSSPPWNLRSFTVESTLSSSCSCFDPPLSHQGVAFAHLDSLPPHNLVLWTDGFVPFPFWQGQCWCTCQLLSLCDTEATLSLSASPVCSSFSTKACTILHALCWSWQHQQVCHFSSFLLVSDSHSVLTTLFCPPSFLLSQTLWQELSSLSPCSTRLQWVPGHSFLPGNNADEECYSCPLQSLVVSLLLSLVSTLAFSRTGGILSHQNSSTHRFP